LLVSICLSLTNLICFIDLHKPSLDGHADETLLSNSEFKELIKTDGKDMFWNNYWQESTGASKK